MYAPFIDPNKSEESVAAEQQKIDCVIDDAQDILLIWKNQCRVEPKAIK